MSRQVLGGLDGPEITRALSVLVAPVTADVDEAHMMRCVWFGTAYVAHRQMVYPAYRQVLGRQLTRVGLWINPPTRAVGYPGENFMARYGLVVDICAGQ